MIDILADTNYSNGYNYQFLERRGITGWIPVFGKFKPDLEGFTYDLKTDSFTCQAGKNLPFKTIEYNPDGKPMKAYWASRTVCMVCPWKTTCTPGRDSKRIVRTNYENEYQRAYKRQHSGRGRRMKSLRQSTVEPVFGSLTQHYGLSKIPMLGISGAHKTMLMSAVAFNIKKYMKFLNRKTVHAASLEVQKNLKSLLKTVKGYLLPKISILV